MPTARVILTPEEFIRQRLVLARLSFRPDISLYRPTPESRITSWLAEQDRADDPPYWAYAWAGGAALALYLRDHPETVRDKAILDFGAGSGLVAIAAARAGASRILAMEPDPIAQTAIRLNADANGVRIELSTDPRMSEVDMILAGDVFYDVAIAARTLPILREAAQTKKVLVGDPFRRDLPLAHLQQLEEYEVPDMGGGIVRSAIFALRYRSIRNLCPAVRE